MRRHLTPAILLPLLLLASAPSRALDLPKDMGKETAECVRCHREHTPGVVYDWARSRHAWTKPEAAFEKPAATRRISAPRVPDDLKGRVVGCFECHGRSPELHPESFDHQGYRIHTLVTPKDCEVCHPVEVGDFAGSRKAMSYETLARLPLASWMAEAAGGRDKAPSGAPAAAQECWGCHGSPVGVLGVGRTKTALGELGVTALENWPNQGIGRLNPDGTRGTCSACHGRHAFAVEDARHPEACRRCHTGGHSPAWEAFGGSAHGALYRAREPEFDWGNVPWVLGQDFSVPTCAACHASQVVNGRGAVVVRRSHDFGSRVWTRLVTPPELEAAPTGGPAGAPAPASPGDATGRRAAMAGLCVGCHGGPFTQAHLAALEATVRDTEAGVRAATGLLREGWARGAAGRERLFDDRLEQLWLEVWAVDAAAARYAAAMAGPPGLGRAESGRASLGRALGAMERELTTARPGPEPRR